VEAADATIEAEQANHDAMQVILLAEVARNYIELRSNQRLQILMQEQLADEQDLVTLTQAREQSGLTSMLDVAEAKAQAANIASQLPVYRIAEEQAVHALSVLLGKEPGALSVRLKNPAAIPQAISIASELPSDLLRRRPDIRQAERALAAANAQIGVATSELYPKINLAAFIGFQNIHITDFTPLGKSWSTAATLSTPIFNWGKLQANVKGTESQFRQAQLTYETTVLTAFKEVEDALVAYVQEQQRHAALQDEIAANQLAVNLSEERYHRGLADFLDVLINRGALLRTQQALVTSDAKLSEQLVALYKAFGGGWQSTNTTP
jgi:NodT family efflux transporter outer membrane factor (OMF) lipoprotein